MSASEQEINKHLRSIHADFDFLLDANVISSDLYDELTAKIPRRYVGKSSLTSSVVTPVVAPVVADVPSLTEQMGRTSVSPGVKSPPPPPPPPQMSPPPPAYGLAQAEALYHYSSTDEGDLPLQAGERITILEYVNNDWWRGEGQNGQRGIFPSNYVRKIEVGEKGYPGEKGAVPYQGGGYPGQMQQAPIYAQPVAQYQQPPPPQQYQQPPPQQQQPQEHQPSKLAQFGKNYGKTFVNATAWGGGMTLGADVINKIF